MFEHDAAGVRLAVGERALFRTVTAWGHEGVTTDLDALDDGFHVVTRTFEGQVRAMRFRNVRHHPHEPWWGARHLGASVPQARADTGEQGWSSSLDRREYEDAVRTVRRHIARGDVYQANICRTLTREASLDMDALFVGVLAHNPARYACRIDVQGHLDVVSASPELYLGREGERLASAPIKGTATSADRMLDKDVTENVMITDLVRNDLQRVCRPGTIAVEGLLSVERHPGLVHLVSTVVGQVRPDASWREILELTAPAGSISGTPKLRALEVIEALERGPRGLYCGAIGWVDGPGELAELAVGIRTFWADPTRAISPVDAPPQLGRIRSRKLHFGVGAGITWDSEPSAEWYETQLKARRLLAVAEGAIRKEEA